MLGRRPKIKAIRLDAELCGLCAVLRLSGHALLGG